MKCKLDSCNEEVAQTGSGRPKLFHSDACRLAYWNTDREKKAATPAHRIRDYDAGTGMGVCEIDGPVKVYAIQDKYKDGRPRPRYICSKRALEGPAKASRQRYLRSPKRRAGRYGLTVAQLDALTIAQLGRCAICGVELHAMQIDHNHETGVVRGLLCVTCNTGLGKLGDSVERLEAALAYLRATA
jgi:hypothetical protein